MKTRSGNTIPATLRTLRSLVANADDAAAASDLDGLWAIAQAIEEAARNLANLADVIEANRRHTGQLLKNMAGENSYK